MNNENAEIFSKKQRVYLCIGSDKLVFDSLGPMTGSMLKNCSRFKHFVYGTMSEPVTALQVEMAIRFIRRFHVGAEVTVVDSAVGKREEIGKIKRFDRGLRPALGIDKEMTVVGDKSIMGIVCTKDNVKNMSCSIKSKQIYDMAKEVCQIILNDDNHETEEQAQEII